MNAILKILQLLFTKKDNSGSLKDQSITLDFDKVEHINGKILKADEINGDNNRTLAKIRIAATALTIAGAATVALVEKNEGVKTTAYKDPVGIPTIGSGTIKYRTGDKAGQSVKMGDTITKEEARQEVIAYLDEQGKRIIDSLKKPDGSYVELYQEELEVIEDFVYNFGIGNWTNSSMRKYYLQGEYILACESYLKYKYAGGKDCSIRSNGCYGVWTRSQKRRDDCLKAGDEKQG